MKESRKAAEIILIALFLAGIILPLAGFIHHGGRKKESIVGEVREAIVEKRSHEAYKIFKKYFDENFGFREKLISWHAIIKVKWLGVTSNQKVVLGKNGWLYQSEVLMVNMCGAFQMEDGTFENHRFVLEKRRDELARYGIHYLYMIAPNKYTIYPEYSPDWMEGKKTVSCLEQLIDYFQRYSDFRILDVRSSLKESKSQYQLYYKSDTHWNSRGAFIVYREIIRDLAARYPDLRSRHVEDYELRNSSLSGNLTAMLGFPDDLKEDSFRLKLRERSGVTIVRRYKTDDNRNVIVTRSENGEIPRAVIFHDSFMTEVIPFLAEHFSYAEFIWTNEFDPSVIVRVSPNVVISEVVEHSF